ncbi:hypothetical protein D9611_014848 [Ephemerocybe angulata]|uniref:RRM domain-containing protein n=1 Tax=Ephemerocybe angulata TaxID=980116 RepID=A0A8H5APU6_9AGAR|nr:hypothetical protein D9611_014848 [Tulosesus angulatus]
MAEVQAPPTTEDNAMQGVVDAAPTLAQPAPVLAAATVEGTGPVVAEGSTRRILLRNALYQNLNEKIKPDVMKASLRGLFKTYGEVLDVVAHKNLRMRGQAFVSFENADVAKKAMKEVQRFPLYSKPMQISFARSRSDAVVQKKDPNNFDDHKTKRQEHKSPFSNFFDPYILTYSTQKRRDTQTPQSQVPRQTSGSRNRRRSRASTAKRPAVQMPDEYLPPNKILFLQNLPESVTKDQLNALFSQYPNLYEVRLIPTKKDIAFVEFLDEGSAGVAKDALHNYKLDGENKIKITFARK